MCLGYGFRLRSPVAARGVYPRSELLWKSQFRGDTMGKLAWTAIIVFGAAFAADQYWNFGKYTDATLSVLGAIRYSFGW